MTFTFHSGTSPRMREIINMVSEYAFSDGTVIQTVYANTQYGKNLVYRESKSGKWLRTEGISFGDLKRTPENLVKIIKKQDPVSEIFVFPEP